MKNKPTRNDFETRGTVLFPRTHFYHIFYLLGEKKKGVIGSYIHLSPSQTQETLQRNAFHEKFEEGSVCYEDINISII